MPVLFRTFFGAEQTRPLAWRELCPVWIGLLTLLWTAVEARYAEAAPPARRQWSFPVARGSTVRVRSRRAGFAVVSEGKGEKLTVTARPRLRPRGVHGREPFGRETPADQHAFTWALEHDGARLDLRAVGELRTAHHEYLLDDLEIVHPPTLKIILETEP